MLGFRFIKTQPSYYIMQYIGGKITRAGAGLSFLYFAPKTSLVLIPLASVDAPFIFNEVTADFQEITLQGQITYRVSDPKQLAELMNFTLDARGRDYLSEDPAKLPQRLINHVQVLTRSSLKKLSLRDALVSFDTLVEQIRRGVQDADLFKSLGLEMLGLSILAVKPKPETARALEAGVREQLLREADEAIYARRNAAVEQERNIKENELNTEIAVENKKRQIREAQMDAEMSVQAKQRQLHDAEMSARIGLEQSKKKLVELATANARQEADAKAYGIAAVMQSLSGVDVKVLQSLASVGMEPGQLIALAFRELAESAQKVGQLNISSELLSELMRKNPEK